MAEPSRKRKFMDGGPSNEIETINARDDVAVQNGIPRQDDSFLNSASAASSSSSSVADLLAVPMDIILCEATHASSSHKRGRNLLLSGEATLFLRVSHLAYEMDVLLDLASQALRQRLDVDCLEHGITRPQQQQPYRNSLLAIIPLLHVHGRDVSNRAIQHVNHEVGRVMQELAQIAITLHQSSEQNWNVAESLRDSQVEDIGIFPSKQMQLEKEKRAISEVQDELETRIQNLTGMAITDDDDDNNNSSPDTKKRHESDEIDASSSTSDDLKTAPLDAFALAVDQESGAFISMNEFCRKCLPVGGIIVKPTKEKNDGEIELVEREKEADHVVDNHELARHNKNSENTESREDLDGKEQASQQPDPVQENHEDTMNYTHASTRGTLALQRQLTPITESVNNAAANWLP